jgi:hypothetical protein
MDLGSIRLLPFPRIRGSGPCGLGQKNSASFDIMRVGLNSRVQLTEFFFLFQAGVALQWTYACPPPSLGVSAREAHRYRRQTGG